MESLWSITRRKLERLIGQHDYGELYFGNSLLKRVIELSEVMVTRASRQ